MVEILPEDNAIVVAGAVPGADGGIVIVHHAARAKTRADSGGGQWLRQSAQIAPVKVAAVLRRLASASGELRIRRRGVRPRRRISAAPRGGPDAAREPALRHRVDQDPRLISGGGRKPWRQKGTGRARAGLDALAAMAPWRHHFRPAAARLFLQDAEEGLAPGAVPGAFGSGARRQADGGRIARAGGAEDQARQGGRSKGSA